MPSSGSGTMTPLSGGVATGLDVAQPLQRTILAPARFARIMGLNPAHFCGGFGQTIMPINSGSSNCDDVWPRYSWQQADKLSMEELVNTMYVVEEEIANYLGYYPAPKWIAKEIHPYPRPYRRDTFGFGLNARGLYKSVIARKGKFIAAGQRAVASVGTATTTGGSLAYTDEDGDGLVETATVTLATALTDECEINTYFANTGGDERWEIRPARSKTLSGGNVILVYDSWLFIDPDLLAALPDLDGWNGIDITTVANYVTSVDVYREYTDFTAQSAEFSWEPKPLADTFCTSCGGSGCAACENITQDGCLHVRDVDRGILVPVPATYDSDTAQWAEDDWTECREPDTAKVWYYAGDLDERFLRDDSCDRLSMYHAQAIAWMTTARLERPPCACNNVRAMFNDLKRDLSFTGTGEGEGSYFISPEDLNNPFGTRKGELLAWKRLGKLTERVPDFALV